MKLNSASDYRFTEIDADGRAVGANPLSGDIYPLRSAARKDILSYEDVCFLHEACNELLYALVSLDNEEVRQPSSSALHSLEIPRELYGAEVGRVSFSQSDPLARASDFRGTFISSSYGDSSHADQSQSYLAAAGADADALFPKAMSMSASSSDLVYVGCWISQTAYYYALSVFVNTKQLCDVYKTLLSVAWSYRGERRPTGTYAYNLIQNADDRTVVSENGGYVKGRVYGRFSNIEHPVFVSQSAATVGEATVVGTYAGTYDTATGDILGSTYTTGGQTFSVTGNDISHLSELDRNRAYQKVVQSAFGISSTGYSAFEIAGLSQTAIGRGAFNFSTVLQDRKFRIDVIASLFELPKLCTRALVPNPTFYFTTQTYCHEDNVDQHWDHYDTGSPTTSGPNETIGGNANKTDLGEAVLDFRREIRTVGGSSVDEHGDYLWVTDQFVDATETHGLDTAPTVRLLQYASTEEQARHLDGLIGTIHAVVLVDVRWDKKYRLYNRSTYASQYDNSSGGGTVAVPVTLTKVPYQQGSTTAEWTCDKSVSAIFDLALSKVSIPFQYPTYADIKNNTISAFDYMPSPQNDTEQTQDNTLKVGLRPTFIGIQGDGILAVAEVTPWTADQTANP